MSALTPEEASARARLAALQRHRGEDDPDVAAARDELRRVRMEQHVLRAVEDAPPLTDAQRIRLARVIVGEGGDDAA